MKKVLRVLLCIPLSPVFLLGAVVFGFLMASSSDAGDTNIKDATVPVKVLYFGGIGGGAPTNVFPQNDVWAVSDTNLTLESLWYLFGSGIETFTVKYCYLRDSEWRVFCPKDRSNAESLFEGNKIRIVIAYSGGYSCSRKFMEYLSRSGEKTHFYFLLDGANGLIGTDCGEENTWEGNDFHNHYNLTINDDVDDKLVSVVNHKGISNNISVDGWCQRAGWSAGPTCHRNIFNKGNNAIKRFIRECINEHKTSEADFGFNKADTKSDLNACWREIISQDFGV